MYTLFSLTKKAFNPALCSQTSTRMFSLLPSSLSSLSSSPLVPSTSSSFLLSYRHKSEKFSLKKNLEIKYDIIQVETESEAGDQVMARVSLEEAVAMASRVGQDVVLVDESTMPPTCEIGSYRKISKKVKKQQKQQQTKSTKELQIRSVIEDHDLGTKLRNMIKLLHKNHPVKLSLTASAKHKNQHPHALDDLVRKIELEVEEHADSLPDARIVHRRMNVDYRREMIVYPQSEDADAAVAQQEAKEKRAEARRQASMRDGSEEERELKEAGWMHDNEDKDSTAKEQ